MFKIKISLFEDYFCYGIEQSDKFKKIVRDVKDKKYDKDTAKYLISLKEYQEFLDNIKRISVEPIEIEYKKGEQKIKKDLKISVEKKEDIVHLSCKFRKDVVDLLKSTNGRKYLAADGKYRLMNIIRLDIN